MKKLISHAAIAGALAFSTPLVAQDLLVHASAERLASAMAALDGRWTGTEVKRADILQGDWISEPAAFHFRFDAATGSGQTLNDGEPPFTVTAHDGALHYAGEVSGQMMEQTRRIVGFWPVTEAGNMLVIAEYTMPGPEGVALTIRETYQRHDGTYIRRQEFRPADSDAPFTLIRDARFSRAE